MDFPVAEGRQILIFICYLKLQEIRVKKKVGLPRNREQGSL